MSPLKFGALFGLLVAGVLALVACGGSPTVPATSPSPAVSTSPSASSSASQLTSTPPTSTPSSTSSALEDGRYPARIVSVDSGRHLVTVDVVQFFVGKAAASAAAQDHAAEVPPPNDYWIRNSSPALRTLYVTSTAPITVNVLGAGITGSATKDVRVSLSRLAELPGLGNGLFWLTVEHQVVTRIAEQYLP